jgi:extracellular elastinolytic metalloproteinase
MGVPIFQAAQTVRFTPEGALAETAGTSVTVGKEVSTSPRLSVQQAVLKAAQHVAVPDTDELSAKDQFGQTLKPPSADVTGFTPKIIALFGDKPDQPTVLEAGPFGDEIKASLMWFCLGQDLRLCWQMILVMPRYEGHYRVLVDAKTEEILYVKQLVQTVAAKASVYRIDPSGPRQWTGFPQPLTDYALPLPPNLPNGFPDTWISANKTAGSSVEAHLDDDGPTLTGTDQNQVLTFDPADPLGDEQKILNIFYYCCFI